MTHFSMATIEGHTYQCNLCTAPERWSSRDAAGCAATWHVYEEHRAAWAALFGTALPHDPRPEEVGYPLPSPAPGATV